VGQVGTEALAALGIAHAALMVVMTLAMGMAVGTLAGVARAIGARRPDDAAAVFGQGVLISLVTGTALALSALFVPPWIMAFMGAEPAVAQPATDYLAIGLLGQLVGAPLMVVTFALQGAGEANAALKVSAVSPIVNAALDPIFIFTLGLGMPGAAWATNAALAVTLAVGVWVVRRGDLNLVVRRSGFRPDRAVAAGILRIGVPGTLEHTVRTVASFSLVKLLTAFGAIVLSAYTSVMVLLMTLILPGIALGQATASLVGQNLGAEQPHRAWRTAWISAGLYAVFMVVLGLALVFAAAPLVRAFDDNPAVVAEGARLVSVLATCLPFIALALVLSKAFGGAGDTLPAMATAATAHLLFQIPAVYFLGSAFGPTGAYWGMAGAFIVHGLLSAGVFVRRFRPD
jgi:putative MATE family efflux protein